MGRFWILLVLLLCTVLAQAAQLHMDFDTSPPQIALLFPKPGLFEINADTSAIGFSFSIKNYTEMENCTLFLGSEGNFAPVAIKYNFENSDAVSIQHELGDGQYEWKVMCYDISGKFSESEVRNLEVLKQPMQSGSTGSLFLIISIISLIVLIFYVLFTSDSFKIYMKEKKITSARDRLRQKIEQLEAKQNEDRSLSEL